MSENTRLWDAVVKTDPKYTKSFRRAGGFEGTAINFAYLARKATEQFGPMGLGWGSKILEERYVDGGALGGGGRAIIHVVRIEFWYQLPGRERATIESYGQTTFVGENKSGIFTDEEAPKKSLTDAMSKALSWLGFGADVHLGMYDDNKYVNDLRKEFDEKKNEKNEVIERALPLWEKDIENANSREALESIKEKILSVCKEHADAGGRAAWKALKTKADKREKEIAGA